MGDHLEPDVVMQLVMILKEEYKCLHEENFTNFKNASTVVCCLDLIIMYIMSVIPNLFYFKDKFMRQICSQGSTAYILSRAKVGTCDTLIRKEAIPILVCLLGYCPRMINLALPVIFSQLFSLFLILVNSNACVI